MNSFSLAPEVLAPFFESQADESDTTLRARLDESGYLFFRGLVPQNDVLQVRRDVLELCLELGWLDPQHPLLDGAVSPDQAPISEGQPAYMEFYRRMLRVPSFHELPNHPALGHVAGKILRGEVLAHRRRIGRVTFPNNTQTTTSPHQDWHYIRGSEATYTCWMPLGDCPLELGGLAVWPGSHRAGFQEHSLPSLGAGGRTLDLSRSNPEWVSSAFAAGDALFFHSLTVHKALPNLTPDRLRLSTDNRFQRRDEAIDPASLQPHYDLDA